MGNKHPRAQQHTYSFLKIVNNTSTDVIRTSVSGVFDNHWAGNCRPDRNFQDVSIPAKTSIQRRFALKNHASQCPFTMTLTFRNGKVDTFSINQKYTLGGPANFRHLTKTHYLSYQRVTCTIVITIEKTDYQIVNERAEERNKQGEVALKQKKYDEAMDKFDKALGLANDGVTISTIKNNKSEASNGLGKQLLQEAWNLEKEESEGKSQEAQSKFDQAKTLFEQAISLHNSSEYQKNLNIVNLKIEGNRLFNEANELDKQAFGLFKVDSNDNSNAQNKYSEALVKYEEAVKKFEEGVKIDNKFTDSVKIAKELVEEVKETIHNIDQAELNHNIGNVSIHEDKESENEDEEVVSTNLHQIVDVTEIA